MMKIGITADVHLTVKDEYPERFHAFANILEQCNEMGIKNLIVAGDLFDQTKQNFGDFEALCNNPKYRGILLHIIPGNHDQNLRQEHFGYPNIIVYSEPAWVNFGAGWDFLFIPYRADKSMGEVIEANISQKPVGKWSLIGHGNWSAGLTSPNPYEPGVYMPITSKDISIYKPSQLFLGHVHKPSDSGNLHYPGSPCGLDITETGYRRFLVFDLDLNAIETRKIRTDIIYFKEEFIVFPTEDEASFISDAIQKSIGLWELDENDETKVSLRVKCRGYSSNKGRLLEIIQDCFKPFRFESEPDLSEVSITSDPKRNYLLEKVKECINVLDWRENVYMPEKDEILLEAMNLIYGEV